MPDDWSFVDDGGSYGYHIFFFPKQMSEQSIDQCFTNQSATTIVFHQIHKPIVSHIEYFGDVDRYNLNTETHTRNICTTNNSFGKRSIYYKNK